MSDSQNSIFWKEEALLSEAKEILAALQEGQSVEPADYKRLIDSYAELLYQSSKLVRISDKQQNQLHNLMELLSRYVPQPVYRKITSGKEKVEINKTRRVKLSIFYSDIIGFSTHSANMEGEELSAILNSYLQEMTTIVNDFGGTLDKYIGDAILVFFGDPDFTSDYDHAYRCVKMALAMRSKMRELQVRWFRQGYHDPLHVRMGISTGYVSVGNFGSSERMDYTIIGSPVNLASRLETAAKADQILISHDTWGLVQEHFKCSEALKLRLKGFPQQVLAYEVYGEAEEQSTPEVVIEDPGKGLLLKYDPRKISAEELCKLIKT